MINNNNDMIYSNQFTIDSNRKQLHSSTSIHNANEVNQMSMKFKSSSRKINRLKSKDIILNKTLDYCDSLLNKNNSLNEKLLTEKKNTTNLENQIKLLEKRIDILSLHNDKLVSCVSFELTLKDKQIQELSQYRNRLKSLEKLHEDQSKIVNAQALYIKQLEERNIVMEKQIHDMNESLANLKIKYEVSIKKYLLNTESDDDKEGCNEFTPENTQNKFLLVIPSSEEGKILYRDTVTPSKSSNNENDILHIDPITNRTLKSKNDSTIKKLSSDQEYIVKSGIRRLSAQPIETDSVTIFSPKITDTSANIENRSTVNFSNGKVISVRKAARPLTANAIISKIRRKQYGSTPDVNRWNDQKISKLLSSRPLS